MKITAFGCNHGALPTLPGGDLLIITGDLTHNDSIKAWKKFYDWLKVQKYRKKVYIAGNHDNFLQSCCTDEESEQMGIREDWGFDYLCDSGIEFEGIKIWGSPWTTTFQGMNPHCKAFTVDHDEQLWDKWEKIPEDTDILITHSPPYMVLDEVDGYRSCGSKSLMARVMEIEPRLHFFSHIHEGYGHDDYWRMFPSDEKPTKIDFYNCSLMDERYDPVNKPWEIIWPLENE